MLKYFDYAVVFAEVPDEITLAINITSCPFKCKNCHSPWLQEDIGAWLTPQVLEKICGEKRALTCVCFMGGTHDIPALQTLVEAVHDLNLKAALYTGDKEMNLELAKSLDYYKIGPYIENMGPLNKKTTNQRMYKRIGTQVEDITYIFWNKTID